MNRLTFRTNIYLATLYQTAIPLILLWLTRFGFYIHNASAIGELSFSRVMQLAWAGLPFDLSAWAYFNVLFVTMRFLPGETGACWDSMGGIKQCRNLHFRAGRQD